MGFLGLGSAITMMRMRYGDPAAVEFTEEVAKQLALAGWEEGLELAKEKGPAPIMSENFEVTEEMLRKRPEMKADGYQAGDKVPGRILHAKYSRYMQRVAAENQQCLQWHRAELCASLFPQRHSPGQEDQGEGRCVLV
jgi:ribonucleoside-diphosphate reductase alpha chain